MLLLLYTMLVLSFRSAVWAGLWQWSPCMGAEVLGPCSQILWSLCRSERLALVHWRILSSTRNNNIQVQHCQRCLEHFMYVQGLNTGGVKQQSSRYFASVLKCNCKVIQSLSLKTGFTFSVQTFLRKKEKDHIFVKKFYWGKDVSRATNVSNGRVVKVPDFWG